MTGAYSVRVDELNAWWMPPAVFEQQRRGFADCGLRAEPNTWVTISPGGSHQPRRRPSPRTVPGGCLLSLDGDLDVDAEHPGKDRGGKFGGEDERCGGAVLSGLETDLLEA
jgi:hypothetical protein